MELTQVSLLSLGLVSQYDLGTADREAYYSLMGSALGEARIRAENRRAKRVGKMFSEDEVRRLYISEFNFIFESGVRGYLKSQRRLSNE